MKRWTLALACTALVAMGMRGTNRASAGREDPVIAVAGDIACASSIPTRTRCHHQYTSDLLVNAGLAKILTLGDNQYGIGALPAFRQYFDPTWGRVKSLIAPTPGNHEYRTPNAAGYFAYFGAAARPAGVPFYAFTVGSWRLYSLDSELPMAANSAQERWLRADLWTHPSTCQLAYWHRPRFSSGSEGSDPRSSTIWKDLYIFGVDVVLNGHAHDYERFASQSPSGTADPVRGIREFVVGTGGKSLLDWRSIRPNSEVRNNTDFGVLKLVLHPRSYDWKFVPAAGGHFTDSGSGSCHRAWPRIPRGS